MAERYRVTMRHDAGTVRIVTAASSPEAACKLVCEAEGAPLRSAVKVERLSERELIAECRRRGLLRDEGGR
jgi:hypothetical protein